MHIKWSTVRNLGFEIRSRGSADGDIRMEKGSFPRLPLIKFWHLETLLTNLLCGLLPISGSRPQPPTSFFRILYANREYLTNVSCHQAERCDTPTQRCWFTFAGSFGDSGEYHRNKVENCYALMRSEKSPPISCMRFYGPHSLSDLILNIQHSLQDIILVAQSRILFKSKPFRKGNAQVKSYHCFIGGL